MRQLRSRAKPFDAARREALRRASVCAFAVWVAAGCENKTGGPASANFGAPGARIRLLSELQLQETETEYIGKGISFAVSPGGRLAVGDAGSSRVLVFNPDGSQLAVVSKRGKGPGELWAPNYLAFASDTALAVVDLSLRRITAFRVKESDVSVLSSVQYSGDANILRAVDERQFLIGMRNSLTQTALARWRLGTDSLSLFIRAPHELVKSRFIANGLFQAYPVPTKFGLLIAFAGTAYAVLTDSAGLHVRDTLWTPAVRRRGIPAGLDSRLQQAFPDVPKAMSLLSTLQAAAPLSDGLVALVHLDVTGRGRRLFNKAAWVSLLDIEGRRACVDASLPVGEESLARFAFHGDTIVAFEQRTVRDSVQSIVRKWAMEPASCEWIPAHGQVRTSSLDPRD